MSVAEAQPSQADLKHAADRLATIESQMEGADINTMATVFVRSGYFQDSTAVAQAAVKVIAGKELGIGAFAAMQGIHIIKGRATYAANLVASLIQRSDRFRYRVTRIDNEGCAIDFYENWGPKDGWVKLGESSFGLDDAKRAKLDASTTYQAFPRNMFFARALTNGARWYCPSITNGEIFSPEELGATTDDEGNVIEVPNAPPWTADEQKALADRHAAIFGSDEERDRDGVPVRAPAPLSRPELWAENRRLTARAAELGVSGVPVLNTRSELDVLASANAELAERIENLELDLKLQQQEALI